MTKRMLSIFFIVLLIIGLASCEKETPSPNPVEMLIGQEQLANVHSSRLYDKESPYTLCFENQDGTKSLYIFNSPVSYYREDDTLEIIDKALVSVTSSEMKKQGYMLEPKSCDIKSYFPKNLSKTPFLIQEEGNSLSFAPSSDFISQNMERSAFKDVEGREPSAVVYKKEENIMLEYIPATSGIMVNIEIKEKPETNLLCFYIEKQESLSFSIQDSQYVLFQNKQDLTNKAVIYTSFLQDAKGNVGFGNEIKMTEEEDRWVYTIALDKAFLEAPETQYPVSITPSFELYRNKMPDSSVFEKRPNTNAYLANYTVFGDDETFGDVQHYLRFRINYIFKSYPQNVKSAAYVTPVLAGSEEMRSIEMKRLKELWSSTGATWNTRYQTYDSESVKELTVPGRYEFNIFNFVKDSIRDDEWNTEGYGLAMTSEEDGNAVKVLATSDNTFYQPYVRIDFYDLPWTFEKVYAINPDQGI